MPSARRVDANNHNEVWESWKGHIKVGCMPKCGSLANERDGWSMSTDLRVGCAPMKQGTPKAWQGNGALARWSSRWEMSKVNLRLKEVDTWDLEEVSTWKVEHATILGSHPQGNHANLYIAQCESNQARLLARGSLNFKQKGTHLKQDNSWACYQTKTVCGSLGCRCVRNRMRHPFGCFRGRLW